MSGRGLTIAAVAGITVGALGLGAAAGALWLRPADGADVEQVRRILVDHPEIIPEALATLQERQVAEAINSRRAEIETPFEGGWIGSAQPTATLVQFYDYACGYCRQSLPVLQRLVAEDPGLRVVFREFPVLGEDSVRAAEASLAAARAGRFAPFHDALYAAGRPTQASIAAVAGSIGTPTADPGARAEIERNYRLAQAVGLNSTPSWVVGDQAIVGAVGYEALKAAIAEARSGR